MWVKRTDHRKIAAALRAAGVDEKVIGDCIRNWWPRAVLFVGDESELCDFIGWWRVKKGPALWHPGRVWNLRNNDGVERLKFHLKQFRESQAATDPYERFGFDKPWEL